MNCLCVGLWHLEITIFTSLVDVWSMCIWKIFVYFLNVDRSMWVNVLLLLLYTYISDLEFVCSHMWRENKWWKNLFLIFILGGVFRILSLAACSWSVNRQWSPLHARSTFIVVRFVAVFNMGHYVQPLIILFKFLW